MRGIRLRLSSKDGIKKDGIKMAKDNTRELMFGVIDQLHQCSRKREQLANQLRCDHPEATKSTQYHDFYCDGQLSLGECNHFMLRSRDPRLVGELKVALVKMYGAGPPYSMVVAREEEDGVPLVLVLKRMKESHPEVFRAFMAVIAECQEEIDELAKAAIRMDMGMDAN